MLSQGYTTTTQYNPETGEKVTKTDNYVTADEELIQHFHRVPQAEEYRETEEMISPTGHKYTTQSQRHVVNRPVIPSESQSTTIHQGYATATSGSKVQATTTTYEGGSLVRTASHGVHPYTAEQQEAISRELAVAYSRSHSLVMGDTVIEKATSYIEVPIIEYVERKIPKTVVVEREQLVPKKEVEYVEKIVYIPEIQVVEKVQEIEEVEFVERVVAVKQYVDIPKEVIKHVQKLEVRPIEKIVEKPYVENVPRPYLVEQEVVVPRFHDKMCPVLVSQVCQGKVGVGHEELEVDVNKFVPFLIPVDVFVPRPIAVEAISTGVKVWEEARVVDLPAAQYNSYVQALNYQVVSHQMWWKYLPYHFDTSGQVALLEGKANPFIIEDHLLTEKVRSEIHAYHCRYVQILNERLRILITQIMIEADKGPNGTGGGMAGFKSTTTTTQSYGNTTGQTYGQTTGTAYGQTTGTAYGQTTGTTYGQTYGTTTGTTTGYPQVQTYGTPTRIPQTQAPGYPTGTTTGYPQPQTYGTPKGNTPGFPQQQGYPQYIR